MRKLTSDEIREKWFKYFSENGHTIIKSAPLIPYDDNSLLWINAGVTPLKKYFDGREVPTNKRLVSIQKCIRTNDIENVGVTARHQTFFEMMGNFSIGDYFRKEAIHFAYTFLTSQEWIGIDKDKLYVTIYNEDQETLDCWVNEGLSRNHIIPLAGNFWEIGPGPSGPDSEIFYDQGEDFDLNNDALDKLKRDEEQDRYVEIWNNVFSQYNATTGLERKDYPELPHKNIDTGAGLERWACILQGVRTNFDTDLFKPIIDKIEELTGISYDNQKEFKIIADHIRAISFAISDGASFSNTGRGYVLRRLIRRSIRFGKKIGLNEPFMHKLVVSVVGVMKNAYPELTINQKNIEAIILTEEKLFLQTLSSGEKKLIELLNSSQNKKISGKEVFKLYDTYGFPFELTVEYLEENGYTTDKSEFDDCMMNQKELAKASHKNDSLMNLQNEELLNFKDQSEFIYDCYKLDSKVIAIFKDNTFVNTIEDEGYLVFSKTCFYAEKGGQISDQGIIYNEHFKAKVTSMMIAPNKQYLHKVKVIEGNITVGDICTLELDQAFRNCTSSNHSSVHLLQYALQTILDKNIMQAGSYVSNNRSRFDFTYTGHISNDNILKIENKVNELIKAKIPVITEVKNIDQAINEGALALFSEKYTDVVRVVKIGESKELCGGTHVKNTDELKRYAITSIESKGSNLYRIEATTNDNIVDLIKINMEPYQIEINKQKMKANKILEEANSLGIKLDFNVKIIEHNYNSYNDIIIEQKALNDIQEEVKLLDKTFNQEKNDLILKDLTLYLNNIQIINNQKVLIMKTNSVELNILKQIMDKLMNEENLAFIIFVNINSNNVNYLAKSNSSIDAGSIVKNASLLSNGNGGGNIKFGQGGGTNITNVDAIIESIIKEIK